MNKTALLFFIVCLSCCYRAQAASIVLHTRDAVAWLPQQTIGGSLVGMKAKRVTVHQDMKTFTVAVDKDHSFSFLITLHDDKNHIWVTAKEDGKAVQSDTVVLQLGYHPAPAIKPYAVVTNNTVVLHVALLSNPWKKSNYHWTDDKRNPAPVQISDAMDSTAGVQIPTAKGVYYFNLSVSSGKDTARFQTYVTRSEKKLQAFDMDSSHAAWIDSAVIYEITPFAFVKNATYDDITAKLPEIKSLGITALWLQPLMQCDDKGQGYEVTDYFSLRNDLGTEEQLQHLITTAKDLGLRVLFDFVPNHTSIHHPYAQDCAAYGTDSHYYSFYQHQTNDGAMYSSQYHTDDKGFVYYFWDDLVNLNYTNPEVQQWMIEACQYWINKFNIDGYRFDAVWGVNARQPHFSKRLQQELKSVKPDLLLLAEDKGAMTSTYTKGFDGAFDWTADTSWVSQWSWQYDYNTANNLIIFSFPDAGKRGQLLQKALFRNGDSTHLRLRFIENNDLPRLILSQGLERTKIAAALTFTLPGIPLIYDGQEVGVATTPSRKHPTFERDKSIQSQDKDSLFPFYQRLAAIRSSHACLRNTSMDNIALSPAATMAAFRRGDDREDIVTVVNMDASADNALLDLTQVLKNKANAFTLTDLLTSETFTYKNADVNAIKVPMNEYSTRILLIGTVKKDWVVLVDKRK